MSQKSCLTQSPRFDPYTLTGNILERKPSEVPEFEDVSERVEQRWIADTADKAMTQKLDELRQSYEIIVGGAEDDTQS